MKFSPFLSAAFSASLALHLGVCAANAQANLEVYCPMDGNLTTTGSTSVTATSVGANSPTYGTGILGQAGVFANNNVGAPPSDWAISLGNLDALYAGDFSMSIWVKTTNAGGGALTGNSNWASGANTGWLVSTFNASREGKVKTSTGTRQNEGLAITNGAWHLVTLVVDNTTDRAFWYLDGLLLNGAGDAIGTGTLAAGLNTMIGGSGGGVESGAATLDDFALFSGKLTNNQISYLYNGGAGRTADQYNVTPPAQDLTWTGNAIGTEWTTNVIPLPKNWVLTSNGTTTADFVALDNVLFNDTATGTTVNIDTSDVTPGTVTFNHSAKSFIVAGAKGLAGAVELIKTGTASLTLSNPNLHTGRTSISNGPLVINHATALQNSTLEAAAATGASHTFGSITATAIGGLSGDCPMVLKSITDQPLALTVGGNNADTLYTGAMSGPGSLTKSGTGRTRLGGTNTFTGGLTAAAGSLQSQMNGAFPSGSVVSTGGTIEFAIPGGTEVLQTNDFILPTTGTGALRMFGVFATAGAAPTPGTTVRLIGKISGGTATRTFRFSDTGVAGEHDNVVILDNPNNDFLGIIELFRATLAITSDAALGNADNDLSHYSESLLGKIRFDADNIELNSQRAISLPGAANNRPFDTQAFTATIAGPISGTGTLVKQGTGRLILTSQSSTLTGAINVAEGTLEVDGYLPAGALNVASAGTLAGYGTIERAVTVTGGTLSPGAGSDIGTLPGITSLTLADSSKFDFGLSNWTGIAGVGHDNLMAGTLNITATSAAPITVKINPITLTNFSNSPRSFTIVSTTNGITGFSPEAFTVDASAIPQTTATQWTVAVQGNDLILVYNGPAGYASWIAAQGLTGPDAAFTADPDNDGIANGVEFVIGGQPNPQNATANSASLLPVITADATHIHFTFRRATLAAGLNPKVQYDTDLQGTWTTAADSVNGVTILPATLIEVGIEQVEVLIPRSLEVDGKLFVRLSVTE